MVYAADFDSLKPERIILIQERDARERRVAERTRYELARSGESGISANDRGKPRPNAGASLNGPLPEMDRAALGSAIARYCIENPNRVPDLRVAGKWFELH